MKKNLSVPVCKYLNKTNKFLVLIVSSSVFRKEILLHFFLNQAKKEKINGKKIYEALLQTYLFAGFPSALISLRTFSLYFKINHSKTEFNSEEVLKKTGIENCKKIYGNKQEKLISNVKKFSPDLSEWLILEGYGKVFGRKGLSIKEREICAVTALSCLTYKNQLYSHINGSNRVGVSLEQINEVIQLLSITGNKRIVNFGLKVLNQYIKEKGLNNNNLSNI